MILVQSIAKFFKAFFEYEGWKKQLQKKKDMGISAKQQAALIAWLLVCAVNTVLMGQCIELLTLYFFLQSSVPCDGIAMQWFALQPAALKLKV